MAGSMITYETAVMLPFIGGDEADAVVKALVILLLAGRPGRRMPEIGIVSYLNGE